jgi:hypothetical protein
MNDTGYVMNPMSPDALYPRQAALPQHLAAALPSEPVEQLACAQSIIHNAFVLQVRQGPAHPTRPIASLQYLLQRP